MGHIAHDAVIVTTNDARGPLPDMDAFRASLPEDFRSLVIGPISAPLNGYISYAWLPDGSKEWWDDSNKGDEFRERFVALFDSRYEDGSSHDDIVQVKFGGDHAMECGVTGSWQTGKYHGGLISSSGDES